MFAAVHTGQPHCQREHDRQKLDSSVKVVIALERAFNLDTSRDYVFRAWTAIPYRVRNA